MSAFFNLNEASLKRVRRLPQLAGKKLIGRGTTAAVFDNGDTVMKLTACEKTYRVFNDSAIKCEGPHFPKTVNDFGKVGETADGLPLYLFEQEKLAKIGHNRQARKDFDRFQRAYWQERWMGPGSGSETDISRYAAAQLANRSDLPPSLADAMSSLGNWIDNHGDAVLDLHGQNVMIRPSTNELVLVDPVVSDSELQACRKRAHKRRNGGVS